MFEIKAKFEQQNYIYSLIRCSQCNFFCNFFLLIIDSVYSNVICSARTNWRIFGVPSAHLSTEWKLRTIQNKKILSGAKIKWINYIASFVCIFLIACSHKEFSLVFLPFVLLDSVNAQYGAYPMKMMIWGGTMIMYGTFIENLCV